MNKTLIQARPEDATLYWIPPEKAHRYAVTLEAETTPMLTALLDETTLTAAGLVHAAIMAVWLAKTKNPPPTTNTAPPPMNENTIKTAGLIARKILNDQKSTLPVHQEPR